MQNTLYKVTKINYCFWLDKRNALKLICKSAFVFFYYPFFITLKVASPSSVVNSNKCITVCEERGEIIYNELLLS